MSIVRDMSQKWPGFHLQVEGLQLNHEEQSMVTPLQVEELSPIPLLLSHCASPDQETILEEVYFAPYCIS